MTTWISDELDSIEHTEFRTGALLPARVCRLVTGNFPTRDASHGGRAAVPVQH